MQVKSSKIYVSGMIFQDHRRVPVSGFIVKIAASEPLMMVTGRIIKISE
jgi:hypothetical protein